MTTPTTTPPTAATTARVRVLTEADVVADIRRHHQQLTTLAGTTDLREIAVDGITYQLGRRADVHFSELGHLSYLANLPSLPCCASHDEDVIDAWVAGINAIVETGQLPDDD